MSYKKINSNSYICDSIADLVIVPEKDIGALCYVIREAADYRLTSDGQWIRQTATSSSETGDYATKDDLQEVEKKIPSINHLATKGELEALKVSQGNNNEAFEMYGLKLPAGGKTLFETVRDGGLTGFKTLWVQKGVADLPAEMNANNQSGRGFFCCDYYNNPADFTAWFQLFVKDGSIYTGFINHAQPIVWFKQISEKT